MRKEEIRFGSQPKENSDFFELRVNAYNFSNEILFFASKNPLGLDLLPEAFLQSLPEHSFSC